MHYHFQKYRNEVLSQMAKKNTDTIHIEFSWEKQVYYLQKVGNDKT